MCGTPSDGTPAQTTQVSSALSPGGARWIANVRALLMAIFRVAKLRSLIITHPPFSSPFYSSANPLLPLGTIPIPFLRLPALVFHADTLRPRNSPTKRQKSIKPRQRQRQGVERARLSLLAHHPGSIDPGDHPKA